VLLVQGDRCIRSIAPGDADLRAPAFADRSPSGGTLICDTGNRRIVELDAEEAGRRSWAPTLARRRSFSIPRSIEVREGRLLVADSAEDVVAEIDWSGRVHRLVGLDGSTRLDDPHSVQALEGGHLLICDSGNSRVRRRG